MAFRLADLLISVIHPDIEVIGPPPPIPPAPAHRPTSLDELRAVLAHATAIVHGQRGTLEPPRTLVEAAALEERLVAALREVRKVKDGLSGQAT
jgi:hypothetical protein